MSTTSRETGPRVDAGATDRAVGAPVTKHATGTREEWVTARVALLEGEKQLTRQSDELARQNGPRSAVSGTLPGTKAAKGRSADSLPRSRRLLFLLPRSAPRGLSRADQHQAGAPAREARLTRSVPSDGEPGRPHRRSKRPRARVARSHSRSGAPDSKWGAPDSRWEEAAYGWGAAHRRCGPSQQQAERSHTRWGRPYSQLGRSHSRWGRPHSQLGRSHSRWGRPHSRLGPSFQTVGRLSGSTARRRP